jgi:hypothetical protein
MDWIHLAQDRAMWWAVVNKIINLWVPYRKITYHLIEYVA